MNSSETIGVLKSDEACFGWFVTERVGFRSPYRHAVARNWSCPRNHDTLCTFAPVISCRHVEVVRVRCLAGLRSSTDYGAIGRQTSTRINARFISACQCANGCRAARSAGGAGQIA